MKKIVVLILMLNCVDIYNTLYIIEQGGVEINPFMNYFLEQGVVHFIAVKMTITTLGLLTLLYLRSVVIPYILFIYTVLITYQFILIFY